MFYHKTVLWLFLESYANYSGAAADNKKLNKKYGKEEKRADVIEIWTRQGDYVRRRRVYSDISTYDDVMLTSNSNNATLTPKYFNTSNIRIFFT